eukprot:CAMPEP_0184497376 /NCGR_PEP_ID=MMETSP0113_2-20130426/36352_1 /TAXON_ID=91329 /ORGANISM="Norrisiella sphaerica, Strain BC52" /LENGTH=72 /DNA_ID=CAMNT_0026884453 /DNA_START=152 /DNA_END=370 /DNA_ORIENTATION=-
MATRASGARNVRSLCNLSKSLSLCPVLAVTPLLSTSTSTCHFGGSSKILVLLDVRQMRTASSFFLGILPKVL